jgi:hypothetical protein
MTSECSSQEYQGLIADTIDTTKILVDTDRRYRTGGCTSWATKGGMQCSCWSETGTPCLVFLSNIYICQARPVGATGVSGLLGSGLLGCLE